MQITKEIGKFVF